MAGAPCGWPEWWHCKRQEPCGIYLFEVEVSTDAKSCSSSEWHLESGTRPSKRSPTHALARSLARSPLQALGSFSLSFKEALDAGAQPALAQQLAALLNNILEHDLTPAAFQSAAAACADESGGGSGPEFLVGRALWVAGRLAVLVDGGARGAFLRAAAAGE